MLKKGVVLDRHPVLEELAVMNQVRGEKERKREREKERIKRKREKGRGKSKKMGL